MDESVTVKLKWGFRIPFDVSSNDITSDSELRAKILNIANFTDISDPMKKSEQDTCL